tara:strand:+ start:268 stop:717 length:450 start_codon:yes stop_codon:yes gene_type:complete
MVVLKRCENINEYSKNLDCVLDNFSSLKDELKTSYLSWKLQGDKSVYDDAIVKKNVNVDNLIAKLRVNLNKKYNDNKEKLSELNEKLTKAKVSLEKWLNKYKKEKNNDLAAEPLNKDTSREIIQEYLYLGFLTVGVIFSSSFLYKTFKL